MTDFELGKTYIDRITGFEGMATAHARYLTGCNQVCLTPAIGSDGKLQEAGWFDEQRLALKPDGRVVTLDNSRTPGFGDPAPKYGARKQ